MTSHTEGIVCPKCGSVDCNFTTEDLGKAITADVRKRTTYCNLCTYTKVAISIGRSEIFTETKLPGSDETELEYKYLGREKF